MSCKLQSYASFFERLKDAGVYQVIYMHLCIYVYIYIAESHDIDIDLNMSNITLVGCGIPNIQEKLCSFVSVTNSVLLVFLSRDNIVPFLLSALAKLVECRRELEDLGLIGITTRTILHTLDWSISLLCLYLQSDL